jgi:hypothetical protein
MVALAVVAAAPVFAYRRFNTLYTALGRATGVP